MTDNLILYELQNIQEALTKTKEDYTLKLKNDKTNRKV